MGLYVTALGIVSLVTNEIKMPTEHKFISFQFQIGERCQASERRSEKSVHRTHLLCLCAHNSLRENIFVSVCNWQLIVLFFFPSQFIDGECLRVT